MLCTAANSINTRNQLPRTTAAPIQRGNQSHLKKRNKLLLVRAAAAETASSTTQSAPGMEWFQKVVKLPGYKRGCHVVTHKLVGEVPEINQLEVGMANFFNVPLDLNDSLDRIAPEGKFYRHDDEGPDDMPAHVKSSLMGASLNIPIRHGKLAMGTWQGIYLNEHRNHGGSRIVIVTVQGKKREDGKTYGKYS